jgi:hypothetical protein
MQGAACVSHARWHTHARTQTDAHAHRASVATHGHQPRLCGHRYAGLKDVTLSQPVQDDTMQTFWLAETLKYFYLLFSDDDVISFDDYVLNTEAHPLRIFDFSEIGG